MKLENQVCSLELAQKLKSLGVKQDSIYYWRSVSNNTAPEPENWYYSDRIILSDEPTPEHFNNARLRFNSAFTVAELGDIFPTNVQLPFKDVDCWKWSSDKGRHVSENEADARAKMLVYLLENKLITL